MTAEEPRSLNFIEQIIEADNAAGRWGAWPDGRARVHTRFPPEPNGYLHIGHAKSINLNYGLAQRYGGKFNLRFDDTNPVKEEQEYVDSIVRDVAWLGARWEGMRPDDPTAGVFFASDYFQTMYDYAVELVKKGLAYVDDQNAEQIRQNRGTLTKPGTPSPFRERPSDESLDLLDRMRKGEFPDGSRVLRAKIDMASPNMNLRDPVMYRILHADHHRTGDAWCIYPMYDWAHGFEDSLEGITHSICTLEFENHRPLYDWFIRAVNDGRTGDGGGPWGQTIHHPQQIEFARLNLTYTVMSKRKLLQLVTEKHVAGWDDPRMPTISGMRRRGFTAEAIRGFCDRIGVSKFDGVSEVQLLEHCVREDLNARAPRVLGVLRPLKVVIVNWEEYGPKERVDELDAVNNPEDPAAGTRKMPFGRELYIERDDFMAEAPKKYFRLAPGAEVRLRWGYFVTCVDFKTDPATGEVREVHCTYDPATRGGDAPDGRKVKGTIHWVSAAHAVRATVRLYDHLFVKEDPEKLTPEQAAAGADFRANLNPHSLETVEAWLEANWRAAAATRSWADGVARVQFERLGYFCLDSDATDARPVFNRTVTLKDSWAKVAAKA